MLASKQCQVSISGACAYFRQYEILRDAKLICLEFTLATFRLRLVDYKALHALPFTKTHKKEELARLLLQAIVTGDELSEIRQCSKQLSDYVG